MDGLECEVDEVKSSEASKTSDNRVSHIYKDDPESDKVMSRSHFTCLSHHDVSAVLPLPKRALNCPELL